MKEYKFKHILGTLGDMQTEWWTEEDWEEWEEECQRMRENGTFGTEVEYTFQVMENPVFDKEEPISPPSTPKFMILDLSNEKNTTKEDIREEESGN